MIRKIVAIINDPYRLNNRIAKLVENILSLWKGYYYLRETRDYEYPITLKFWFYQKVLGINAGAYWPMHPSSLVSYPKNVLVGLNVSPGYSPGCYIHAINKIYIGDYTYIAPNVGLMSGNHDTYDRRKQTSNGPIKIGKYCWLSMNTVILPGVVLGDFTIVGAGAVVTKSFPDGYCTIVGNPAKIIKHLSKEECIKYSLQINHIGYIPINEFKTYRKSKLNI